MRFHKIRELIGNATVKLEKVHTSENIADMLTKTITVDKFKHFLDLLSVEEGSYPTYYSRWRQLQIFSLKG